MCFYNTIKFLGYLLRKKVMIMAKNYTLMYLLEKKVSQEFTPCRSATLTDVVSVLSKLLRKSLSVGVMGN